MCFGPLQSFGFAAGGLGISAWLYSKRQKELAYGWVRPPPPVCQYPPV